MLNLSVGGTIRATSTCPSLMKSESRGSGAVGVSHATLLVLLSSPSPSYASHRPPTPSAAAAVRGSFAAGDQIARGSDVVCLSSAFLPLLSCSLSSFFSDRPAVLVFIRLVVDGRGRRRHLARPARRSISRECTLDALPARRLDNVG